ncbi:crossover junction endodeoxyribonuclease RuvC [Vulgatibacter incomptus]|uniref:Crossover junction endodeoxyribonuclease RuvC n=1 Tax=Vulgatibacter incomptus TaxID=1391653 RepID=A0A0K1PCT6_9BACT|nr:crossover junction endodeoxyribonuclease RuvC [Vulgatibacter incomptus]AKU91353.1 Crossover junction endodeoxyribonuclease RuvC [Vulgatibacter incomptus]
MRVLGIDPGSRHTGYGVVDAKGSKLTLVACGTLSPGDALPLAVRLGRIHAGLVDVVARTSPEAVSVEEVYHAVNARSALVLGQARGAALVAAAGSSIEVFEYAASEIKRAVSGSGRAGKEQVSRMVSMLLGVEVPGDEHACDAIAAAICHLNRARMPATGAASAVLRMRPAVVPPRPAAKRTRRAP